MGLTAKQRDMIRRARSEHVKKRTTKPKKPPPSIEGKVIKHGTNTGFRAGCNCVKCTKAHRKYTLAHRKVPCINYPECENMVWFHGKRSGKCRSCASRSR